MNVSAGRHEAEKGDRLRYALGSQGIDRAEVFLAQRAYAPHRHDRYVIGFTTVGVQTFDYRGETRHAQIGEAFVLHPDERHDGRPGDAEGFGYHCLYVAPEQVTRCLKGRPLPFVSQPVSANPILRTTIAEALAGRIEEADAFKRHDLLCGLAWAMAEAAGQAADHKLPLDQAAMERIRDLLLASLEEGVGIADLEAASGHDRWSLYRQFRAFYGISPHRYLTMRRLDRAQQLIAEGDSLAETALACGFADQSHMTRRFQQAFGLSPGRWRSLCKTGPR